MIDRSFADCIKLICSDGITVYGKNYDGFALNLVSIFSFSACFDAYK